jgi:hypothetical protein
MLSTEGLIPHKEPDDTSPKKQKIPLEKQEILP